MASSRPKNPDSFPPEFLALYSRIPEKESEGKSIVIGRYFDITLARDRQRLVRQYNASLRKYPFHEDAWIEDAYEIRAELTQTEGVYIVSIVAKCRKNNEVLEGLLKWYKSLNLH